MRAYLFIKRSKIRFRTGDYMAKIGYARVSTKESKIVETIQGK